MNHVSIVVDDLERTNDFYERLLGLRRIRRPPEVEASGPGAWYALGGHQLHLFTAENGPEASSRHFAVEVDDLDSMVERIRAAGLEVEDTFSFGQYRRRRFVRDPSGNRIELMSRT